MILALLLDQWLGEPERWHPLVGFGLLANRLEQRMNQGASLRLRGIACWLLLLGPLVLLAWWLSRQIGPLFDLLVLYLALGAKSLAEHARAVYQSLLNDSLAEARQRVGWIVSRDTQDMDQTAVTRATIESVLENGADAIFAALFWFLVAGAPGVLLYRLANTLDAMWGYRTERFKTFGWCAARMDDLLNWLPARLTAISYALAGNGAVAWRCWRAQAITLSSPNGGPVMTAGAGALGILLGGPTHYHGHLQRKPFFGVAEPPQGADIPRALGLLQQALVYWVLVAAGVMAGGYLIA